MSALVVDGIVVDATYIREREAKSGAKDKTKQRQYAKTETDAVAEREPRVGDQGIPHGAQRPCYNLVRNEAERNDEDEEPSPDGLRDPLRFVSRLLL